jgi:putative transposase
MSHLRRIAQADRVFFVTTNISRNVPFLRPSEMDLLLQVLDKVRSSLNFQLISYVIMPDHAHLLFATQTQSLSHIMHQWKFKTGYAIQQFRHHSGAFWQPRYFDFICRRASDVSDKLSYIHQNPIAANLVLHPEDWKWSSAAFYLRQSTSPIRPDVLDLSGDPNAPVWPVS